MINFTELNANVAIAFSLTMIVVLLTYIAYKVSSGKKSHRR